MSSRYSSYFAIFYGLTYRLSERTTCSKNNPFALEPLGEEILCVTISRITVVSGLMRTFQMDHITLISHTEKATAMDLSSMETAEMTGSCSPDMML